MTKPRTEARIVASRINAALSCGQSAVSPAAPRALQKIIENEALKKVYLAPEPELGRRNRYISRAPGAHLKSRELIAGAAGSILSTHLANTWITLSTFCTLPSISR